MRTIVPASFVIAILFLLSGCGSTPEFETFAKALRAALDVLTEQRDTAVKKYIEAENARREALLQPEFKFSSAPTRTFIDKWKTAETEVASLRKKYSTLLRSADLLFSYCYEKCGTINDQAMRLNMHDTIERHQKRFADKALTAHRDLASVEKTIGRGKDLIKALEIVGALGTMQEKAADLDNLAKSAANLQPTIDALKVEGESLLKLELAALIQGANKGGQ